MENVEEYHNHHHLTNHEEDKLSSFDDLKRNTNKLLYDDDDDNDGGENKKKDKSPKGCIDEPIRELVDIINASPYYTTLSSCSGRISLFHPNNETKKAKGEGSTWLFAHHSTITVETLSNALKTSSSVAGEVWFQMEPLLLHVASCTLKYGRWLLQLVLSLGFRESGMIITDKKCMIAIRSHSLSMQVPIYSSIHLPPAYLHQLVNEANQRFQSNHSKLLQLQSTLLQSQQQLYLHTPPTPITTTTTTSNNNGIIQEISFQKSTELPLLNLWGHTSALIQHSDHNTVEVLIFGGYGTGPQCFGDNNDKKAAIRSNSIYSLKRISGVWETSWIRNYHKDVFSIYAASCILSGYVVIFGGRKSPIQPTNDLYLYDPITSTLIKPSTNSNGTSTPSPRWGHTLTPISSTSAICIGGNTTTNPNYNDNGICILTMMNHSSHTNHPEQVSFVWEEVVLPSSLSSLSRFHHDTVLLPKKTNTNDDNNDDEWNILIFGGIQRKNASSLILQPQDTMQLSLMKHNDEYTIQQQQQQQNRINLDIIPNMFASSFLLLSHQERLMMISSGGIHKQIQETEEAAKTTTTTTLSFYQVFLPSNNNNNNNQKTKSIEWKASNQITFASLVHHSMEYIRTPTSIEILILGGGVDSFAFGPTFAR